MTDTLITLTNISHPRPTPFEPATVWQWSISHKGETLEGNGYCRELIDAALRADEKRKELLARDLIERNRARAAARVLEAG